MDIQLRTTQGAAHAHVNADAAAQGTDAASLPGPAGGPPRLAGPARTDVHLEGLFQVWGAPREVGFTPSPAALTAAASGWAESATPALGASKASAASSKKTTSSTTRSGASSKSGSSSKKSGSAASSAELAFLSDPRLSIEEKLFQFMALMTRKNDERLEQAMRSYSARKEAADGAQSKGSGTASSSARGDAPSAEAAAPKQADSGGGGLFGFVGDVVGGIADAVGGAAKSLVGSAESLAKELGGPLLASAATAVGAPFLAPVALSVGGPLSAGLIDSAASLVGLGQKKTSSKTSTSSSSRSGGNKSTASKSSGSKTTGADGSDGAAFDEKLEMLELQQLVDRQSAMFSALSNAMKSMHEMQMTAVNNIR